MQRYLLATACGCCTPFTWMAQDRKWWSCRLTLNTPGTRDHPEADVMATVAWLHGCPIAGVICYSLSSTLGALKIPVSSVGRYACWQHTPH